MKTGNLTKKTKMFNARLLPDEIEIIRRIGSGNVTAGLRRMIYNFVSDNFKEMKSFKDIDQYIKKIAKS